MGIELGKDLVDRGPAPPDPFWLGQAMVDGGAITEEQFASARQLWRKNPRDSFAAIIERLDLASPDQLAEWVARRHGLAVAGLGLETIDRAAVRLMPLEISRKKCILPYRQDDRRLHVAIEDPGAYGASQARKDFPNHEVQLEVASRRAILGWIEEAWRPASSPSGAQDMFAAILREAVADRATDLHLEPRDGSLDVRLRIDGRLVHRSFIEPDMRESLIQAAKIAGRMDISERRLPQDGRGSLAIGARHYYLRFSCIPAINGESVVVRIIDDQAGLRTFADMGLLPEDEAALRALLALPNGLVYVTGPTGSGKTTLLYSMLRNLPSLRINEMKIVTLEEPVELRDPRFFLQIEVDERIGRGFGELLRFVLRHDPDVILIGETRDRATAETTLRAALTGRLCLSTLHTNDAVGAVARLSDIGLDPVMLASALKGVIAQRLVRRPCPRCRRPHPQKERLEARFAEIAASHASKGEGFLTVETGLNCAVCKGRGYQGRTAIIEVCPLGGLERLIAGRAPAAELRAALRSRGGRTLFEDGVRKAALGLTTIEEVHAAVEPAAAGKV